MSHYNFLFKPIFFIISLLVGTYIVLWVEKVKPSDLGPCKNIFERSASLVNKRKLSEQELLVKKMNLKKTEEDFKRSRIFLNHSDNSSLNLASSRNYLLNINMAYKEGIIDSCELADKLNDFLVLINNTPALKNNESLIK